MSFVNNYTPAPKPTLAESELFGPTPYDINFAWPLHEKTLSSDRLKLVPFIPSIHGETYWVNVKDRPELFKYYPRFHSTLAEFLTWVEFFVRRNPYVVLLAIIDTTRLDAEHSDWGGSLAGILTFCNTIPDNLHTEIGYVVTFPEFHHTHVAKHLVALSLRYLLNLPTVSPPGIGFRRIQWNAHPGNAPSIGLAERMGFRKEGILRWLWVLPEALSQYGDKGREGDQFGPERAGRHTVALSVCWDDWEGGVGKKVDAFLG